VVRFVQKVRRTLKKPRRDQLRIIKERLYLIFAWPFLIRANQWFFSYLAYQPDSHVYFNAHPEFKDLFRSFTTANRICNAGDIPRLWSFILNCKQVIDERIPGDFAELGVWRGNSAAVLAFYAKRSNRDVFLFDTFEGFSGKDLAGVDDDVSPAFDNTSLDIVRRVIGQSSSCCHYVQGYFPASIQEAHRSRSFAVVSLDCDLYEPTRAGLAFFYARMPQGGIFFLHDYSSKYWAGAKQAIDEFCRATGEFLILMPDKSGSAFFRKSNPSVPSA
jgi:Macrocin-O-methyltransferase (TylF)